MEPIYKHSFLYKGYRFAKPILYYLIIEMCGVAEDAEFDDVTGESITKSKGGIILTKQTDVQDKNNSQIGKIIAMGDDVWNEFYKNKICAEGECPFKVGDFVSIRAFTGQNVFPLPGEKPFTIGRFQMITNEAIRGLL